MEVNLIKVIEVVSSLSGGMASFKIGLVKFLWSFIAYQAPFIMRVYCVLIFTMALSDIIFSNILFYFIILYYILICIILIFTNKKVK